MNVLLIGHACGPGMGSEPGNTWNWAQYLSREHHVWVLAHPQYRDKVEAYVRDNPNPNVQFVWITLRKLKRWLDPWDPRRGERGIRLHYVMWLSEAYEAARKLCREISFDIAHHVSWSTVSAAPPLWRLPIPSVWGPVGGGQCAPSSFLSYFGRRSRAEFLRTCRVRMLQFSPRLRKAARSSAAIVATNRETGELVKRIGENKVRPFLDCGLPADYVITDLTSTRSRKFTLLWAGRLEPHKGLALGLQALARVNTPVNMLVAGAGCLRGDLERLANDLGLADRVQFLGSVPYEEMKAAFQCCDAFLFTSLRDSFGSVVLEAMAHGLPILALNHQGVGAFVPEGAAIKVSVTTPEETIQRLAEAISNLCTSEARCQSMRVASWNFAREQTWDRRAKRMSRIYEEVLVSQGKRVLTVIGDNQTHSVASLADAVNRQTEQMAGASESAGTLACTIVTSAVQVNHDSDEVKVER